MLDDNLKITDKRMFTADGELRDEYRHLEEGSPAEEKQLSESPGAGEGEAPEPPKAAPETQDESAAEPPVEPPRAAEERVSEPEAPRDMPAGGTREVVFEDLVGLLAEHAAIALGDAQLPDGQSMFDLRVAQMHIDLLDVLREKTSGNLTEQQASLLEELLYRLRLVYVEKSREKG